jgi:chlorobactene glucosyltransferase
VIFVFILTTAVLVVISLTAVLNTLTFPRLRLKQPAETPLISVLIPARNEAKVIDKTLKSLLAQDYRNFEVILLDDESTDGTAKIARDLVHARLTVIEGQPLPEGWLGKNWACHQLAKKANGAYLLFTDADVQWSPGGLSALVGEAMHTDADLLTVWPTQQTVTWAERLVVPLMALAVMGYLPVLATHYLPFSVFAAACGQCMVWKREAYHKAGGHSAVAANVLEDVTMARIVKRRGLRLRMADGAGLISCRMYDSWYSVRNGYAKNILAGYGNSVILLFVATIFHWLIYVLPPVWQLTGWTSWAALLTILAIGVRMLTAAATRQRVLDGLLMPVSVVLMTLIAFQSIYWRYRGGNWKGRVIKEKQKQWQKNTSL